MENSLVTVESFSYPAEAHLARVRLESAGIRAYLLDENMINADPLLWPALGGVKVAVAASDVDKAREVLSAKDEPLPE